MTDDVSLWLRNTIGTDLSRLQSIGHLNKWSLPGSSDGKESACSTGDLGSISPAPLEKAMASHSSVLAWKIPWT